MPGDPRPHDHDNSIKNNHNNRGALVTLFEVNPDPKPIDVFAAESRKARICVPPQPARRPAPVWATGYV